MASEDNPFFNTIGGILEYQNWAVETVSAGNPGFDYFDLLYLDGPDALERMWFDPDLTRFRRGWVARLGAMAPCAGPRSIAFGWLADRGPAAPSRRADARSASRIGSPGGRGGGRGLGGLRAASQALTPGRKAGLRRIRGGRGRERPPALGGATVNPGAGRRSAGRRGDRLHRALLRGTGRRRPVTEGGGGGGTAQADPAYLARAARRQGGGGHRRRPRHRRCDRPSLRRRWRVGGGARIGRSLAIAALAAALGARGPAVGGGRVPSTWQSRMRSRPLHSDRRGGAAATRAASNVLG